MENNIIKAGFKNTIFVLISQISTFILGVAKNLILPIALGVTNFGYWQVYLMYLAYIMIFDLGFSDGIYLRYGKYSYDNLPKNTFKSSIRLYTLIQIVFMFVTALIIFFEPDVNKRVALLWVSFNIPIMGLTTVLFSILQTTNKMKKYSFFIVLDKLILIIAIFFILLFSIKNFYVVIVVDTFSKLVALGLLIYTCRDIVVGKCNIRGLGLDETKQNIKVGVVLLIANFLNFFVLGFGRLIVERFETVDVYSVYSFSMSTMYLVLVFVTAIGLVIYPTLNRLNTERFSIYFMELNKLLGIVVYILLISYYPLKLFIINYMNDYIGIFEYLPFIYAAIFVQSKMLILINPYYKLLREEKAMLKANVIGLITAIIFIAISYVIWQSVLLIAVSTLIAILIRLYMSELYIKEKLKIEGNLNIIVELSGLVLFIFFSYLNNSYIGILGYSIFVVFYTIGNFNTLLKFKKYFLNKSK